MSMSFSSLQSRNNFNMNNLSCANRLGSTAASSKSVSVKLHPIHVTKIIYGVFSIYRKIGQGSFGKVYLISFREDPTKYSSGLNSQRNLAMKTISWKQHNELVIHKKISGRHPNIIKLEYYYIGANDTIGLIMEFMIESLHNFVRRYRKNGQIIPDSTKKFFMKSILSGLEFLHNLQIIHRDIKSLNILVDIDNFKVKLADFGHSKDLKTQKSISTRVGSK